MASIKISELRPSGSELFQDDESFLNELTERDMFGIAGGGHRGGNRQNSIFSNANTQGNNNSRDNSNKVGC